MTDTKTLKIEVHTSNFEHLYKRLLLQPMSIHTLRNELGCVIELTDKDSLDHLIKHIANTVNEEIFNKTITNTLESKGILPGWTKKQLLSKLKITNSSNEWTQTIEEDIAFHVNDSIKNNEPFNLDAYTKFGTTKIKEAIKNLGLQIEEELFEEVVIDTISMINIDETETKELPDNSFIEIVGTPTDMVFLTGTNENDVRKKILETKELLSAISVPYADMYHFNSARIKELEFYAYTLLLMERWNVKKWIVGKDMQGLLESVRDKLDIPVTIATNC